MMKNYLFFLLLLLVACHNSTSISEPKKTEEDTLSDNKTNISPVVKEQDCNLDSVRQKILKDNLKSNHSDTIVYDFSLEGDYSAEGNEGKAFYIDNQIKKISITFYGESGKSIYTYIFENDKIMVEEKRHEYDVPLSGNIKSTQVVSYQIDYNGKIISNSGKGIDLDTYFILKKSIPFTLK
ncbi:hypothetical protein EZ428_14490 [Pedobacter frigiditerrae]|uniref:Lipoprotein n=1 Tax=Pedobacter frigiditerrae TaxID=2530452 RepID=A0A4R0MTR9_9SPHI|nr:hypothetical protein [Pedobacter frigiditerrae]TCC90478.1 hypothetical protein EZ428_14490 [Pedobacter frigiditerrae]